MGADATIDDLWASIEAMSQSYYDRVKETSSRLAAGLAALSPNDPKLVNWLKERVWSEREGARMHAYVVVQMADVLDPPGLVLLARQAMEEGMHYQHLFPCLVTRGGSIASFEPRASWRAVFADEFAVADERDPISLYASFHMGGEGPASASAEVFSTAFLGTPNEDISLAYQKIAPDERGHWGGGRKALRELIQTTEEAHKAIDVLGRHGEHLFGQFQGRATEAA